MKQGRSTVAVMIALAGWLLVAAGSARAAGVEPQPAIPALPATLAGTGLYAAGSVAEISGALSAAFHTSAMEHSSGSASGVPPLLLERLSSVVGAGSALRSILPLVDSGSSAMTSRYLGTMYSVSTRRSAPAMAS